MRGSSSGAFFRPGCSPRRVPPGKVAVVADLLGPGEWEAGAVRLAVDVVELDPVEPLPHAHVHARTASAA